MAQEPRDGRRSGRAVVRAVSITMSVDGTAASTASPCLEVRAQELRVLRSATGRIGLGSAKGLLVRDLQGHEDETRARSK